MPACDVIVSVTFVDANAYKVSLPANPGYTVKRTANTVHPVPSGGSYSFTVTIWDGYEKTENFKVYDWNNNKSVLTPDDNGIYTISNVDKDLSIVVDGVMPVKPNNTDDFKADSNYPFSFVCSEEATHTVTAPYFDKNYAELGTVTGNTGSGCYLNVTFKVKDYFEYKCSDHSETATLPETATFQMKWDVTTKTWYYVNTATEYSVKCASESVYWTDPGNYDISWYTPGQSSYTINDAADLAGLAVLVNGLNGETAVQLAGYITIQLANDIDLSAYQWKPIGSDLSHVFSGTFNGNGKKITGMTVNETSAGTNGVGLFGRVNSATIRDLDVTGSVTGDGYHTGGIVGYAGSSNLLNCTYSGSVKGFSIVGGIVGTPNASYVHYCTNHAEVTCTSVDADGKVGGIAGDGEGYINYCRNFGTITGSIDIGGIAGKLSAGHIKNSYNAGSVSSTSNSSYVGSIVSYINPPSTYGTSFENCYYLKGTAAVGVYSAVADLKPKAIEKERTDFASGDVTYLLNGSTSTGNLKWYQNLDNGNTADAYPTFSGGTVYVINTYSKCDKSDTPVSGYSNTDKGDVVPEHVYQYTADGAVITESCQNCNTHSETATLKLDTSAELVYAPGEEQKPASVDCSEGWQGGELTVSYENNVNAGDNTAKASVSKENATAELNFSIKKANPAYTTPTELTAVYGETLADVKGLTSGFSFMSEGTTPVGDAGENEFFVKYTPDDEDNYSVVENITVTVKVAKKNIADATVGAFTAMTYNGSEQTPSATVTIDGLTATGTWSKVTNVADKTIFTANGNFEGTITEVNPGMLRKEIGVSWSDTEFTYDKTPHKPIATATGLVEGDSCEVTVSGEQTNAGTGYDATAVEVSNANYVLVGDNLSTKFVINKAPVTEPTIASKVYNGSLKTADVPANDLYMVKTNIGGTDVYEYDVVLTLTDIANYKWSTTDDADVTLKFNITAAENAWVTEPSIDGWTYGQIASTPSYEAKFGTVKVEYKKSTEEDSAYTETVPENAGDYKVRFSVVETANYGNLSEVLDLVIAKAIPAQNPEKLTTARVRRGNILALAAVTKGEFLAVDGTTALVGTFAWVDDTKKITADSTEKMKFTPIDTNYAEIEIDVEVDSYTTIIVSTTTYVVTFETNGGSEINSVKVTKNADVTEPTAPTKDGYTFDGWYTDKKLTNAYDFDDAVTKNFTLYAKWTEIKTEEPDDNKPGTSDTECDGTIADNCPSLAFDDLDVKAWYHLNVDYVLENGLMKGTDTDKFAPNDNLTRAMLVTILYRAEGEPATNRSIPFSDVDMGSYYASAVIWAKQNGIVNGVSETEFAPNDNITREQIAAIMFRYAQYKGVAPTGAWAIRLDYADLAEISDYATEAVMYCKLAGIMQGKGNNNFAPKDNATRAEIAAILERFIEAN